MENINDYSKKQADMCIDNDSIPKALYADYGVKKGLRDDNGQGVLTGLTNISSVRAFDVIDGEKVPCDGELLYRGYDVTKLVKGAGDKTPRKWRNLPDGGKKSPAAAFPSWKAPALNCGSS